MGARAICCISLMCRDEVNVLIDTRIKIYLNIENLLPYLKLTGNSLWLALNHQVIPTNLHSIDLHRVRLRRKHPTEIWIYVMSAR